MVFCDTVPPAHVIEPQYPLGVDAYLPLTQFVDDAALSRARSDVILHTDALAEQYRRLTRILSAVKSIQDEEHALILSRTSLEKITRRARGIVRREIKKCDSQSGRKGAIHKRFLSALDSSGQVVLWDTVHALAERVYELEDNYAQAKYMLPVILNAAHECNHDVYACYDPMEPRSLAHLIIPDLSLAFVSSASARTYTGEPYRRIRLDACIPPEIMRSHRLRLRFLQKTERALLSDAAELRALSHNTHDQLESIYNGHVDFIGLRAMADAYAAKIMVDWGKKA